MPTYDYYCKACNHTLEIMQKITEHALTTCPKCHAETFIRRPAGGIGLSFKGDGFYSTMYGQNKNPPPDSSGPNSCPCGKNKCS